MAEYLVSFSLVITLVSLLHGAICAHLSVSAFLACAPEHRQPCPDQAQPCFIEVTAHSRQLAFRRYVQSRIRGQSCIESTQPNPWPQSRQNTALSLLSVKQQPHPPKHQQYRRRLPATVTYGHGSVQTTTLPSDSILHQHTHCDSLAGTGVCTRATVHTAVAHGTWSHYVNLHLVCAQPLCTTANACAATCLLQHTRCQHSRTHARWGENSLSCM